MSCTRETTLFVFIMYLSPLMSFILQWIALIFGRDEEEDQ